MNLKKISISGLAGSIAYFFLGWIFYGMLFTDIYANGTEPNLLFIYLGGLTFALMVAYIFVKWAKISTALTGATGGGTIGVFYSLGMNFFMYSTMEPNYMSIALDVAITFVMSAVMGAFIAVIIGKLK
jgi:hypothetical protein